MQDNYNDKMMMVEYARKYVPYYTKLYECLPENIVDVCFEKIPTVDKKMLLKGEVCLSLKFIGEYIRDELIHVYTSGSTGVSSEIYWNPKEMKNHYYLYGYYVKNITASNLVRKCVIFI